MQDAGRYILLVDDEPAHAEAIRRAFHAAGLNDPIQVAGTLREYREMVAARPPQIAIIDLNLPDGRALEVLSSPPEAGAFPVVVMTSHGNQEVAVEAMKAGALDYVVKSPEAFAGMPRSVERARREWALLQESKRAQEALRESEERFRELVELLPVTIFEMDPRGALTYVNQKAFAWFGYRPQDLVQGVNALDMIVAPDRNRARESIQRVLRGETVGVSEYIALRKDGSVFPVLLHSTLILRDGEPAGLRGSLIDITERKQTEEALRQSEEWHRTILQTAMDGFAKVDTEGRLLEVNETYCRMSGYSQQELLAMRISELAAGETASDAANQFERIVAQGEYRFESRHRQKDGSIFDVEISAQYRPTEGRRCVAFLRDVTDRKRAEEALRDSEKLLRTSQKVAGLGSYVLDIPAGTWKSSAVMNDIFGIDETFARSMPGWSALVHPEWREQVIDYFTNRVLGEHNRFDKEYMIVRHCDGQERWVHGLGELEFDAEGRPVRMIGVIVDITERKRTEARLMQAQKMESVGRLAGGVAHDFNNLLTVINGYSQLLLGKLRPGDPLWAGIEQIHKAGERAARLTGQLLACSRKQVLQPRVLDLNRVVEGMRPMLERLVGEAVEVRVALNAGCGTVRADSHQLEQVLMNLAVNARDAMPRGGKLLIETDSVERDENYAQSHPEARAGRYLRLAVSDNGDGMDEETRQRIFDPFFTTKETGRGTGLGLPMVQGIVAQSGGYVQVYSEPCQGTTFNIYLPRVTEVATAEEMPEAAPALGGKETVLVVEDRAEVREYAVTVLKAYGYRVIKAENPGEALLLCERDAERIDLVLTDVVMPKVSGPELASRIEKLRPGIKVLFMSGYTDSVIVEHGLLEENAKFIRKPFSPEQLAIKIREVLGPPAPPARILVADDEAGVRGFLRAALEQGGHEVTEAANGRQALQQARAGHVDLVITDLVMPEQEGIETIQALRKEMPGIGIIAISGAFKGQFLKMAQMLGADAVLTKPVSVELLLAKVAEVLQSRR